MNFDYDEQQQLLADSVRRYLQKDYDFEKRKASVDKGCNDNVWSTFAEMGLTGLPLSPDYGGFGGGAVDLMDVMEAFGEALVVEPYVPTVLAAIQQTHPAGAPSGLGIGGLPEMLALLSQSMRFREVYAGTLGETKVYVARGEWKSVAMAQGKAIHPKAAQGKNGGPSDNGAVDPKDLWEHVPTHVWLYLGQKDLFPYRVDYCRSDQGDERPA